MGTTEQPAATNFRQKTTKPLAFDCDQSDE